MWCRSTEKVFSFPPSRKGLILNTFARLFLFAAACGVAAAASADEVYGGAGTTGVEMGYGLKLDATRGVRVEANLLKYSPSFSTSDVDYDAKLKFGNAGMYFDWFPGDSSFRVSTGALIGPRKLEGTGRPNGGAITINGVAYSAPGESLYMEAKFPIVSPYIGIGWGHKQSDNGGGFYADFGTAYGRPKVTLTASPGLLAAAGQANIDEEQRRAQDKADKLRFYPVLKVGYSYAF